MAKLHPGAFKFYRLSNGLTVRQIAKELGVSLATVFDWQAGKKQPAQGDNFKRLAELFGCTIADLSSEMVYDFRKEATDGIQALFNETLESTEANQRRIAVDIFKHLYPEGDRYRPHVEPSTAEQHNEDLLEEGDVPDAPLTEDEE